MGLRKTFFKDELSKTGQTKTDYALTIDTDMAKELCMVENNDDPFKEVVKFNGNVNSMDLKKTLTSSRLLKKE